MSARDAPGLSREGTDVRLFQHQKSSQRLYERMPTAKLERMPTSQLRSYDDFGSGIAAASGMSQKPSVREFQMGNVQVRGDRLVSGSV